MFLQTSSYFANLWWCFGYFNSGGYCQSSVAVYSTVKGYPCYTPQHRKSALLQELFIQLWIWKEPAEPGVGEPLLQGSGIAAMVVGSCGEWRKPRSSCGLRCSLPYFLWLKYYPGVCGLVRSWLQMTPVCRSDSQLINSVPGSRFFPLFSLPTIDSDLLTACIFHAVSLPVVWWAGALLR